MPMKLNLKVLQGSTYKHDLRWESNTKVYKSISSIQKSAPVEISTIEAHGAPEGWRVKITNAQGMREINNEDTYFVISNVLPGSFQINCINAVGYSMYTTGGVVEYNKPVDLTGSTARMQIRSTLASEEVILELTTENGGILIDATNKVISIYITAEQSKLFTFNNAVYGLEIISSTGEVTSLVSGIITLTKEVTR